MVRIIDRPSPNFNERRGGGHPAMVVLHYTAMETAEAAIDRLCDPAAAVSAHYLIAPGGEITALVDERMRAWHAGQSGWAGGADINSWSIGIELANPGHHLGYPPYPEPQMSALESLLAGIAERWHVLPERVVGHACIAPGRKIDPGEKLDWRRLARRGLAIWRDLPRGAADASGPTDAARFRAAARRFGYPLDAGEGWTDALRDVWQAYAMRFLAGSALFTAGPSAAGVAHLEALAARWPARPFQPIPPGVSAGTA